MAIPKASIAMRDRLAATIARLEQGPSMPLRCGESDEFVAGLEEGVRMHARWRETWALPDLRAVLAYLDGAHTATEIDVYGMGESYHRPNPNQGKQ